MKTFMRTLAFTEPRASRFSIIQAMTFLARDDGFLEKDAVFPDGCLVECDRSGYNEATKLYHATVTVIVSEEGDELAKLDNLLDGVELKFD